MDVFKGFILFLFFGSKERLIIGLRRESSEGIRE